MLDERDAHSPLAFGLVRCGRPVAAAVRGPQVARAVGRVIQVPGLIAPDDAAAAGTADLTLGNLGGPAPAKGLVLRPVSPLLGCSSSLAHLLILWGDVGGFAASLAGGFGGVAPEHLSQASRSRRLILMAASPEPSLTAGRKPA
jgi:hypothetical protein